MRAKITADDLGFEVKHEKEVECRVTVDFLVAGSQ
jgi:hypothetical protein